MSSFRLAFSNTWNSNSPLNLTADAHGTENISNGLTDCNPSILPGVGGFRSSLWEVWGSTICRYRDSAKAAYWVGPERIIPAPEEMKRKKPRGIKMLTVLDSTFIFQGLVKMSMPLVPGTHGIQHFLYKSTEFQRLLQEIPYCIW